PESLMNPIRETVAGIDPGVAVATLQPMTEYVDGSLASDRFTTTLLGGFALLALLLAVVGLYGVVSYAVSTRMREMGVRIALGAGDSTIRGLVLRWSLGLAAAGIVLGAVGALGLSRLMETLLYDVPTTDPVTFTAVSLIMVAAAVLASLIPAIRATRVDPIEVLKAD
ncbi:MAG: FtsX-like permease family protein, partial [Halobacteriales archaeon]|nr:FtsX-like permease family protein [Halobacteriales archaeon]